MSTHFGMYMGKNILRIIQNINRNSSVYSTENEDICIISILKSLVNNFHLKILSKNYSICYVN